MEKRKRDIAISKSTGGAWPQEAYRPPCSKYSLCCSVSGWEGGTPVLTGGTLFLASGIPALSWLGGCLSPGDSLSRDMGTSWKGPGTRDQGKNLRLGTPWRGPVTRPGKEPGTGILPRNYLGLETCERTWDWATRPPPHPHSPHRVDRQRMWKQYLPHPSDAGGNNRWVDQKHLDGTGNVRELHQYRLAFSDHQRFKVSVIYTLLSETYWSKNVIICHYIRS